MECNEVFSISRSTMLLGRKHGANTAEMDRMMWNSPPVGTLQATIPPSHGTHGDTGHGAEDWRTQNGTMSVRYRAHSLDDGMVPSSSSVDGDVAVLTITDSVLSRPSIVLTEASADSTSATPSSTPPAASVDIEDCGRRLRRWLNICHCERHLFAIKLFYFTFVGALGVAVAYCVVFMKQIGLSPTQIGIIGGVRPALGFISAPAWGAVADRYNIRRFLMLVSLMAWLVFFAGLYFVEAPMRRSGLDRDRTSVDRGDADGQINATTAATTVTTPLTSNTVDFHFHASRHKFSTAATTTSTAGNVTLRSLSTCVWNYSSDGSRLRSDAEQEKLREHLDWLYEPNSAYRVFIICLLIICGGELFQSPTTAMSDAATLQILGRDQLDKYGAQRAWGPLGWAACTFFTGAVLNAHRQSEVVCGVKLTFTDYRVISYIFIAALFVCFVCAVKINFATKKADDLGEPEDSVSGSRDGGNEKAATKDRVHNSLAVLRMFLNVRNGSWILTIFFIGACNGLIWGFLFWHLENLGATQLMMGVSDVVVCIFEFLGFFVVDYFIRLLGHAGVVYVGLVGYAVRFVVYASVRNPWTVLPVQTTQGVTYAFTWVSMCQYTAMSVPPASLAMVQGMLHGVYYGLGLGVGHLVGGLAIDEYGAPATLYAVAVVIVLWLVLFFICQKLSKAPVDHFAYQDMDGYVDVTGVNSGVTSSCHASTAGPESHA